MGDAPVQTLEIIGHDASTRRYFARSFDNHGTVSAYQAILAQGAWTIVGDSERFTGAFNEGGTVLTGTWERLTDDARWTRWMTITLTKAT